MTKGSFFSVLPGSDPHSERLKKRLRNLTNEISKRRAIISRINKTLRTSYPLSYKSLLKAEAQAEEEVERMSRKKRKITEGSKKTKSKKNNNPFDFKPRVTKSLNRTIVNLRRSRSPNRRTANMTMQGGNVNQKVQRPIGSLPMVVKNPFLQRYGLRGAFDDHKKNWNLRLGISRTSS